MNILLVNQDWFAEEFREAGHRVMTCGLAPHLDIHVDIPLLHIDSVLEGHDFQPDVVVWYDNSAPVWMLGLDESDVPTVFYSVDVHHHLHLHRYLYRLFDCTLVAQRDYIPQFADLGGPLPEWFPLWASRYMEPSDEKEFEAIFVGNLNPALNPDRVRFFAELEQQAPVRCLQGDFWKYFPKSEIVLNQTVKGDLNFRVFEAMMSGAMLLTEHSPNGLTDLFTPGVHLVTYEKGNVAETAAKIREHLSDRARCRAIGLAGRDEIIAKHTPLHRARRMLELLPTVKKKHDPLKFSACMVNFTLLGLRLEKMESPACKRAFLAAMRSAEEGMQLGEHMDDDMACNVIVAAAKYDRSMNSKAGDDLIHQLATALPEVRVLALARLRSFLNRGMVNEAAQIARELRPEPVEDTFAKAEKFISMILQGVMQPRN